MFSHDMETFFNELYESTHEKVLAYIIAKCGNTADEPGEYAIYSGDKNVTNELVIEIGVNEEEDRVLFVD